MSLRLRFLIAVNIPLLGVLAIFMVLDFRFQRSTHLSELTADTRREAKLLAQTVRQIPADDDEAMQLLVDRATEVVRSESLTRRDMTVLVAGNKVIAPADSVLSAEQKIDLIVMPDAGELAITGDWVVGRAASNGRQIYVFRGAAEARSVSAEHALWRLAEIGFLGLLATALINLMLIRLVVQPFSKLAETIRRIGQGELGATTGTFRSREFRSLAADLNQMSQSLAKAETDRGVNMAKASRLQQHLQSDGVEVPGLRVVHWHEAADHVAGDYFDLLRCPNGAWLICIADVTGHGVAAAMGATILKTLLWSAVETGADLKGVLQSVNQRFSDVTLEEDFASLMLFQWHPEVGELHYASAGHETAYLLSDGLDPASLDSTGTLVGIAHDESWEIKELVVRPGNQLILYTDGITEARSPAGVLFGRERLARLITTHSARSIDDTINSMVNGLRSHLDGASADDDITLVGLEFAVGCEPNRARAATTSRQ